MVFLMQKHNLSGRSMIEMIAVIAIIGFLSIGSLLAYRYAMSTKNANDVIDYVSVLSLEVQRRNKAITNVPCEDYNGLLLSVPKFFSNCTVSFEKQTGVEINVSYVGDSTNLVSALENRTSSYLCIQNNATYFNIGNKNGSCDNIGDNGQPGSGDGGPQVNDCDVYGQKTYSCTCASGHHLTVRTN